MVRDLMHWRSIEGREIGPNVRGKSSVSKVLKTLDRILRGNSDAGIRFDDLRSLLGRLGFTERTRGDHHIFTRDGVAEILNLQPRGGEAKPYQVKQVRGVIVAYGLAGVVPDEDAQVDEEAPPGDKAGQIDAEDGDGA